MVLLFFVGDNRARAGNHQEVGTLTGTLVGPDGAVPNVYVDLRWNNSGDNGMCWNGVCPKARKQLRKKTLRVATDSGGRFSIALTAGNWDVFAYFDGYAPTCAGVLIEPGKTTTLALQFPRKTASSIQ